MDPRRMGRHGEEPRCTILCADSRRPKTIGSRAGKLVAADRRRSPCPPGCMIMSWYRRLRNLTRRNRVDRNIDRELSFHIAERIDELRTSGISEDEAKRIAGVQFGNYTLQKERTRAMKIPEWIESLGQDLRFALRSYRTSPAWTIVAVLSLALGIGANVAVFTLL